MSSFSDPATVPGAIEATARRKPEKGITLVSSRQRRERRTFPEIVETARLGAGRLSHHGVGPGDRVVVALATSWAWFEAWLGTLWLGGQPIALAPGASPSDLLRLAHLVDLLDEPRIVAARSLVAAARDAGLEKLADATLPVEELSATPFREPPFPGDPDPEDLAFLQLTSGSTGMPRAVKIGHRRAIHNMGSIDLATGTEELGPGSNWVGAWVSWLPLHHDMGLVGNLLNSLVSGFELYKMSPRRFVGDPGHWIETLSNVGSTISSSPDFAFQLCADRADSLPDGIDLSGWSSAMSGAEMIQPATVAAFLEAFEPRGFAPESLQPSYGLAEATLGVCVDNKREGVRTLPAPYSERSFSSGAEVACLGLPLRDTELRIVAPDSSVLAEGREGEVMVRSPGLFLGYLNDEEATAQTLVDDGWMRTGDLGFLVDDELYLTGRIKDLLIIRGHNVAPHEIEWLAAGVAGEDGAHRTAAFSISRPGQGEEAVVVVETSAREPEACAELDREVRLRVAHDLKISLADVVLVRRGRIPKTTSGKTQRRELRRRYEAGSIERIRGEAERGEAV